MKIGLSYSRCVRDIVEGKVDIADVLVIIARTDFDPNNDEQWQDVQYHNTVESKSQKTLEGSEFQLQ